MVPSFLHVFTRFLKHARTYKRDVLIHANGSNGARILAEMNPFMVAILLPEIVGVIYPRTPNFFPYGKFLPKQVQKMCWDGSRDDERINRSLIGCTARHIDWWYHLRLRTPRSGRNCDAAIFGLLKYTSDIETVTETWTSQQIIKRKSLTPNRTMKSFPLHDSLQWLKIWFAHLRWVKSYVQQQTHQTHEKCQNITNSKSQPVRAHVKVYL
jgi:hypothetical protein